MYIRSLFYTLRSVCVVLGSLIGSCSAVFTIWYYIVLCILNAGLVWKYVPKRVETFSCDAAVELCISVLLKLIVRFLYDMAYVTTVLALVPIFLGSKKHVVLVGQKINSSVVDSCETSHVSRLFGFRVLIRPINTPINDTGFGLCAIAVCVLCTRLLEFINT